MKRNTWIAVMIAIAVTASIVVARSLITFPEQLDASSMMTASPTTEPVVEQAGPIRATQPEPPTPPTPGLIEQAPTVHKLKQHQAMEEGWTVLVVRGNEIEHVTYRSPELKGPTP